MNNSVCGVVVTYHPEVGVAENLMRLRSQVEHLVVVDNGSSTEELSRLRDAAQTVPFRLIENGDNLGIATALNVGVRAAQTLGAEWVLFFDQDSQVTDGFAAAIVYGFKHYAGGRLGILAPTYIDSRLGTPMDAEFEPDGTLETAMTSGTLMRTEVFAELGFFVDAMFIDAVDHEYSLRLRMAGYVIAECPQAVLLHAPGSPRLYYLPGRAKPLRTANYSPVRRYYQERNKIWLKRRYGKHFPAFFRRQFTSSAKDFVKILLLEKDKWRKARYFLTGTWHGLTGRMGKYTA